MSVATLHIVDVNHGNAALLVDSGRLTIVDVGNRQRLLQFLLANEFYSVEAIIISHADGDHCGCLIDLIMHDDIHIGALFINSDSRQKSNWWTALRAALKKRIESQRPQLRLLNVHTGTATKLAQGALDIEIANPDPDTYLAGIAGTDYLGNRITEHSLCVVVRVLRSARPLVLLPGDLDYFGLARIDHDNRDIQADLLIFPHHGGRPGGTSTGDFTELLMKLVKPKWIVFSVSSSSPRHPREEIVEDIVNIDGTCILMSTGSTPVIRNVARRDPKRGHRDGMGHIEFALNVDGLRLVGG